MKYQLIADKQIIIKVIAASMLPFKSSNKYKVILVITAIVVNTVIETQIEK
tara:strand:+ start:471 stop:623 length:153 start_codon:yes stop_codon:yes gene_type:complete